MALTARGAQLITLSYRDRDNNIGRVEFNTPSAVITEDVVTFITGTLIPQVSALTDAVIVGWSLSTIYEDLVAAQAAETSDIERKGVFSFRVQGGGVSTVQIPSILNTKVVDGTNAILTTDTAVAAFIATMVDTGLFDLEGMGNYRGDKLLALSSTPHKIHRGSKKG